MTATALAQWIPRPPEPSVKPPHRDMDPGAQHLELHRKWFEIHRARLEKAAPAKTGKEDKR